MQAQLHREGWVGKIFLSCQQLSSRAKTLHTRTMVHKLRKTSKCTCKLLPFPIFYKIKQNCKGRGPRETRH